VAQAEARKPTAAPPVKAVERVHARPSRDPSRHAQLRPGRLLRPGGAKPPEPGRAAVALVPVGAAARGEAAAPPAVAPAVAAVVRVAAAAAPAVLGDGPAALAPAAARRAVVDGRERSRD
jgi:hypothetical protein